MRKTPGKLFLVVSFILALFSFANSQTCACGGKCQVLQKSETEDKTINLTSRQLNKRIINMPPLVAPPSANLEVDIKQIVIVNVFVNTKGQVIRASAIRGHPALKGNAEKVALLTRFSPLELYSERKNICGNLIIEWNLGKNFNKPK